MPRFAKSNHKSQRFPEWSGASLGFSEPGRLPGQVCGWGSGYLEVYVSLSLFSPDVIAVTHLHSPKRVSVLCFQEKKASENEMTKKNSHTQLLGPGQRTCSVISAGTKQESERS